MAHPCSVDITATPDLLGAAAWSDFEASDYSLPGNFAGIVAGRLILLSSSVRGFCLLGVNSFNSDTPTAISNPAPKERNQSHACPVHRPGICKYKP
jgi:hypothetical protein